MGKGEAVDAVRGRGGEWDRYNEVRLPDEEGEGLDSDQGRAGKLRDKNGTADD